MKRLLIVLAALTALSACTTTERDAFTGGAIGTVVGAAVTNGRPGGLLVGAAVGALSGVLIGKHIRRGECVYRDHRGRRYIERCPRNYRW